MLRPVLCLAFGLAGCLGEAPHENPFDPQSDRFQDVGTVEGQVTGIYPPFDGRPGVSVRLLPDGGGPERATTTGPDGRFALADVPSGRYLVRAEGEGLAAEAAEVTVEAYQTTDATLQLNALPVVTSQTARTVHIERWFPETPVYRLEVEAEVTDPDRATDVDGVALAGEAIGLRAPLTEVSPGRFAATLDADAIPGGQVQALLGQALRIEGTDVSGATGLGAPLALVRVIEQTPLTASPQGLETITANPPVLSWRPAALPFAFTYRADVFLLDGAGIPNLVHTTDGLGPAVTSLALPDALPSGDYFWTVWVTDAAGNRSRSKEAGFRVP